MATPSPAATRFAEGLTERFASQSEWTPKVFTVDAGKRYDRIVQRQENGSGGSVHAFVERETGQVYKADGWKRPAKGVRYQSVENALAALKDTDWSGGYLYAR